MRAAFALARQTLPPYTSKFSRRDFTLPQLFAYLVVKEHQRKSYREAEALLRDSAHRCRGTGMKKVPDHNTLCRAFRALNLRRRPSKMLDRLRQWFAVAKQLGSMAAIDSTVYDTHHRSRHYEQRCRHYEQRCRHYASRRQSTANTRRSRSAKPLGKAFAQAWHRRVHALPPDPVGPTQDRHGIRCARLCAAAVRRLAAAPTPARCAGGCGL